MGDARAPRFATTIAVGKDEAGGVDEDGSTIRPEGITATANGDWIMTANEAESSISLVKRLP